MCDGERGSGPERADYLCLVSFEALGLNLSINNGIWALRLWFEPWGGDLSLEAVIWASRLWFEPRGCYLSPEAEIWALRLWFEHQGCNLSQDAGIWASRLGFGPQGWDLSLKARKARIWASKRVDREEEEGGEGKISPMCESIGHWPLRGRCPKRENIVLAKELTKNIFMGRRVIAHSCWIFVSKCLENPYSGRCWNP